MTDRKLVLYPRDPHAPIDAEALERTLREIDFIGRSIEVVGDRRFRPGDRFEHLVEFGASGRVFEDGRADPRRCSVAIPEVREEIDFLGGSNVAAPNCACGFVFDDWSRRIDKWRDGAPNWHCDGCGADAPPWAFNWDHSAGFGRYNIDVFGIDLGEAVPSPDLLQTLARTNNAAWDYFYFVP